MIANYPSSSRLKRVYEQNAQHNFSVQQICCPPTIPFVNIDPNNQSTMYRCILYEADNVTNWDGLASVSQLTISTQMQERWFWLRAHVVLFPALSFGSEGFTPCFRPWVLSVPLWLERVPMHLACARPLVI